MLPHQLDHIIFAAPALEQGMDAIEELLGIRPVIGGKHPSFGTHNALLSIGDEYYLEVIAPDPSTIPPARGIFLDKAFQKPPHLATWVMRSYSIVETLSSISNEVVQMGALQSGKRQTPDGTMVSWMLSDPYVLPLDGAVPFIIDWGTTPHPANSLPKAGVLTDLVIECPEPKRVEQALAQLGTSAKLRQSAQFRLIATLETENGVVELC